MTYRLILCAVIASLSLALPTHAATTVVDLRVEAGDQTYTGSSYITDAGCTVTDNTGLEHSITGTSALCATQAFATSQNWELDLSYYDGFGLLLNGVDMGTASYTADSTNYWLYYVNSKEASVGIADYSVENGDEVLLAYGEYALPLVLTVDQPQRRVGAEADITLGYYVIDYSTSSAVYTPLPDATISINTTTYTTDQSGAVQFVPQTAGEYTIVATVDGYTRSAQSTIMVYDRYETYQSLGRANRKAASQQAVHYLLQHIDDAGLVAGNMANTEWAAMALKAMSANGPKAKALYAAVINYRPTSSDGTAIIARHILALEAIYGKSDNSSRNTDGADYVERLLNTFDQDTQQFGSTLYCNDDIFAVLALIAADEPLTTPELSAAAAYTLQCETVDGFAYTPGGATDTDTTAAWLMMASRLKGHKGEHQVDDLTPARQKAYAYFKTNQNPDGGWGYTSGAYSNASSTSWVLMALRSRKHYANEVRKNHLHGFHYITDQQQSGGAVQYDNFGSQSDETYNAIHAILALKTRPFPTQKRVTLK